jgi:hypothetical protein
MYIWALKQGYCTAFKRDQYCFASKSKASSCDLSVKNVEDDMFARSVFADSFPPFLLNVDEEKDGDMPA